MIHIASSDVSSGATYNGVWSLNNALSGNLIVKDTYVETGDIPWMYSGVNTLQITRIADGTPHTVSFADSSDDTPAAVELVIEAAFDAVAFLAGTVATYDAANNEYDVTVSEAITLQFATVASPSRQVFNLTENIENVTAFSLPATYIDNRPKYLEFHITETSSNGVSTRGSSADLFVPTFDTSISGSVIGLSGLINQMEIELRRPNVQSTPLPFTGKWDLVFIQQ